MDSDNASNACDRAKTELALLFTEQWREIFETHVIPRLKTRSEVKFLSMAFRDARDAIVRAKIKVRREFKISEFTSVSQLELAWDSRLKKKKKKMYIFCYKVAEMNKLEYLVWVREVKNCDWDERTIDRAAYQGNLAMVKYCVENGCPMDEEACEYAASEGHLDVLKYLHKNGCPWNSRACYLAHFNNRIDCLNYLIEQKCPGFASYII